MSIGKAIREARGSRDQRWLAEQLGVHQSTVSDWENDRTAPRGKRLGQIEQVLGLEPGTLAEAAGYIQRPGRGWTGVDLEIDLGDGKYLLVDMRTPPDRKNRLVKENDAAGQMMRLAHDKGLHPVGTWPDVIVAERDRDLQDLASAYGFDPERLRIADRPLPVWIAVWEFTEDDAAAGEMTAFGRLTPANRRLARTMITEMLRQQGLDPDDPDVGE